MKLFNYMRGIQVIILTLTLGLLAAGCQKKDEITFPEELLSAVLR